VSGSRFDPRQRRNNFSCSLCVQTGSGAHPASCAMGTGDPFPGAKARPGRDADRSPPLVPRSRMSRSYSFSLSWHLHGDSGTTLLYKLNIRAKQKQSSHFINTFESRVLEKRKTTPHIPLQPQRFMSATTNSMTTILWNSTRSQLQENYHVLMYLQRSYLPQFPCCSVLFTIFYRLISATTNTEGTPVSLLLFRVLLM
jgi:hypothetical protein